MTKQITKKERILQVINEARKLKDISYKELARRTNIKINSLRDWLWCLEHREGLVVSFKTRKGFIKVEMVS